MATTGAIRFSLKTSTNGKPVALKKPATDCRKVKLLQSAVLTENAVRKLSLVSLLLQTMTKEAFKSVRPVRVSSQDQSSCVNYLKESADLQIDIFCAHIKSFTTTVPFGAGPQVHCEMNQETQNS